MSVGAEDSGVTFVARRLLAVAGLSPDTDLQPAQPGIIDSVAAMREGRIDAFFWSGGLPTAGVTSWPPRRRSGCWISTISFARCDRFPVYASGTVPARTYDIPEPITTLLVRNVLLVTAAMPDDLAGALVDALVAGQEGLAQASIAALTIDPRSAIGTQPVPLHPGAAQFYRAAKTG